MKSDKCSVRPPQDSSEDCGGRVQAGMEIEAISENSRVQSASSRPVFPVGEAAGDDAIDDLFCYPCEEEGDELIADGEEEQAPVGRRVSSCELTLSDGRPRRPPL